MLIGGQLCSCLIESPPLGHTGVSFPTPATVVPRRAEDFDSSQGVRDHLVAYHLAPAITDFISDENRVCCNNDLEQTLTLQHSEWSKEIEPSGQSSTHHPLVVSNPIDEKGLEFMRKTCGGKHPRCQHLHMTLDSFVSKKHH